MSAMKIKLIREAIDMTRSRAAQFGVSAGVNLDKKIDFTVSNIYFETNPPSCEDTLPPHKWVYVDLLDKKTGSVNKIIIRKKNHKDYYECPIYVLNSLAGKEKEEESDSQKKEDASQYVKIREKNLEISYLKDLVKFMKGKKLPSSGEKLYDEYPPLEKAIYSIVENRLNHISYSDYDEIEKEPTVSKYKEKYNYSISSTAGKVYPIPKSVDGKTVSGYENVTSPPNPKRKHPITHKIKPHKGIDIGIPTGTPVLAIASGKIHFVRENSSSAGKYIIVKHDENLIGNSNKKYFYTVYMHLSEIILDPGDIVRPGDMIGLSGNTGRSTSPHLHFSLVSTNNSNYTNGDSEGITDASVYSSLFNRIEKVDLNKKSSIKSRSYSGSVNDIKLTESEVSKLNKSVGKKLSKGTDFADTYGIIFAKACAGTPIFPSVKLAQFALETGYGKSVMGNAKAMFGIKATSSWKGKTITVSTTEEDRDTGRTYKIKSKFRAYDSYLDSIKDHNRLLLTASHYQVVRDAKTPEAQCQALEGGTDGRGRMAYATDSQYAEKLMSIINQKNLKQFDNLKF